jgi:hypothetical protein
VDFTRETTFYSQSQKALKTRGAAELRTGEDVIHLILDFRSRNRSGIGVLWIAGASQGHFRYQMCTYLYPGVSSPQQPRLVSAAVPAAKPAIDEYFIPETR